MYQSLRDESESETKIHTFLTHFVLMFLVGGWLVVGAWLVVWLVKSV